jgi:hypothetical protein
MVSLLEIAAAEEVIDGPFLFDSELSWHGLILPSLPLNQP